MNPSPVNPSRAAPPVAAAIGLLVVLALATPLVGLALLPVVGVTALARAVARSAQPIELPGWPGGTSRRRRPPVPVS